jgi:hypothetical protein
MIGQPPFFIGFGKSFRSKLPTRTGHPGFHYVRRGCDQARLDCEKCGIRKRTGERVCAIL